MDELLRYAKGELDKGYSPVQVKEAIIRSGYSPAVADGVMQSVIASRQREAAPQASFMEKRLNSKIIIAICAAALLIAAAIAVPFISKGNSALLDVSTTPAGETYHAGDNVEFDLEIFNMGTKGRFDITLQYKVFDKDDNLITAREETLAISTSTSYRKSVKLPSSMRPGDYSLKVFANYDDKIATSAFTFTVIPKEATTQPNPVVNTTKPVTNNSAPVAQPEPTNQATCTDGIRNQNEAGIDCGGICSGYWYDLECHNTPKPVAAASQTKSTGSLVLEARMLAKTDSEGAKNICLEFSDDSARDTCLKSVAQAGSQSQYCELIINDNDRDLCYYPFFMQGDYTVCDKLVLKESLQTCAQLREISSLSKNINTNDAVAEQNNQE
jgi:hypothetical protein